MPIFLFFVILKKLNLEGTGELMPQLLIENYNFVIFITQGRWNLRSFISKIMIPCHFLTNTGKTGKCTRNNGFRYF